MRSAARVESHPIHPMLIVFPFAYLVGSACIGWWARLTHRPRWFRTANDMSTLGLGSAIVAAVPGLIDYVFVVPPKSSAKERATNHMLANLSALALFALSRAGRDERDEGPRPWALALEAAGVGLLGTGGWLGGTLVYRNQIGVDHRYANAGQWRVKAVIAADELVDAGGSDDLRVDQMKLLRIGDRRIVLARTEQGHVAFDDRCTHKGGPLADGVLACGTVQCPWHGSQFDVQSGSVRQGPAEEPIGIYETQERGGRVFVRVPKKTRAA